MLEHFSTFFFNITNVQITKFPILLSHFKLFMRVPNLFVYVPSIYVEPLKALRKNNCRQMKNSQDWDIVKCFDNLLKKKKK